MLYEYFKIYKEVDMENKLKKLYEECIEELKSIDINIVDNPVIGEIDIKIEPKNLRRYGCCKQDMPDQNYYHIEKKGRNTIIKYDRFHKHHIEITKWVLELDDKIIKNTILHEIIHCFPGWNNHGTTFKSYAKYINQKLGYDITRLGNKENDFKKSNLNFEEELNKYKYKIQCKKCGEIYYRKRLTKNLLKKYCCSKCGGRLKLI